MEQHTKLHLQVAEAENTGYTEIMKPVIRVGRPPKPSEQKFVGRLIKAPPRLWQQLDAEVPERLRAQFVREALEKALQQAREEKG